MVDLNKLIERMDKEIRVSKRADSSMTLIPVQYAEEILDILKEQEPKTPIHIHEEYPEHDWETDEDGKIDEWVLDYGYHNGPGCKRCGYSFCMHCKPNGWNAEPCVKDYYQCPKCRKRIHKNSKDIEYCINCGQAVNWNDLGVL